MTDATAYPRYPWELRMLDIVLTVPALLLLAPVMLLIALAVKLDSRGPVIYSEARLGRDGKPFTVHKFRTLHPGRSEESLVALPGDPRITRAGRRLRPTHLDELPQLLDVLRGCMSLVGPRPARAEMWAGVPADLRAQALSHRPGMTSPASVAFLCENRFLSRCPDAETLYRDVVFPEKAAEDVRYFESRTFWSDFGLLLRTLLRVGFRRRDEECRKRLARLLGTPETARKKVQE